MGGIISTPKDILKLSKEEKIMLISHVMAWTDRGPFTHNRGGFDKLTQTSKDPMLFNYFRTKMYDENKKSIRLGLIFQEYTLILDPYLATQIFKNTIPFFPPAILESNLSGTLAPTQTTLSMDETWLKRRCLSEDTLGFTPLGSTFPLESFNISCPLKNHRKDISSSINNMIIDIVHDWFKMF
ncbi:putative orfan [Tupanvirus soda lake]|uniref:Orfan n=2 Tax=Tupanvirus TaxID=2094720 RepID=A0AC62AD72_9VIRU|nr:putative orfan [Tupanvirus soda lake]QKU35689.1 putative orfan [Tupanvirus soda lake]